MKLHENAPTAIQGLGYPWFNIIITSNFGKVNILLHVSDSDARNLPKYDQ